MKNSRGMIMLIVAAYIGYLGVKLIRDMVSPDPNAVPEENPTLFIIIGIVFIIAAAFIIVKNIRDMARERKEQEEEERLEQEAKAAEKELEAENAPETEEVLTETTESDGSMSIADRIKMLSSDEDEAAEKTEE